jgi:hypothetical protein
MHYTNHQLEAELQKISHGGSIGPAANVTLPAELPADTFRPMPEVMDFVRRYEEYQRETASLNVGVY